MAGISSLNIAISGMWAAQGGLSVTGHNLANVQTYGYSRQSIIQADSTYLKINGGQLGYGTDIVSVRQIRNEFIDIRYRNEVTKATYYSAKVSTGKQIESLLGELQSDYTTESVINDLWDSINELAVDPSSLEARGNFVATAITMVDKMGVVYEGLIDYQLSLNEDVKRQVNDVNYYVGEIDRLSNLIKAKESTGANANDYRDARNNAMDALSEICNVNYRFKSDKSIDITLEGRSLLTNGVINKVGLRYTGPDCSYVEPVFTESKKILNWDDSAFPLYDLTKSIDTTRGDDGGLLKGTLIARGLNPVTYATLESLVPSSDFIKAGSPDPKDYPLGVLDPAFIAAADVFEADLLNNLVNNLGFLPKAPIAPDPTAYTSDTTYHAALNAYYDEIASFNDDRTYDAPVAPNPYDTELYPGGPTDPLYTADYNAYLAEVNTYNTDMQSLTPPTAPAVMNPVKPNPADTATYPLGISDPAYVADLKTYNDQMNAVAKYNLQNIQYQEDNNKFLNYKDKYDQFRANSEEYDFRTNRQIFNATECTIPVLMQNLDQLFHDMVTLINDTVAPLDHNSDTSPYGVDAENTQFFEVFIRKYGVYEDRYDAAGNYYVEDPAKKASLYSLSNVEINPELLNPNGYNKIAFSSFEDPSDNTLVNEMIEKWKGPICKLPSTSSGTNEKLSIDEAYNTLVTLNANQTHEDNSFLEAQVIMVNAVEDSRLAVMGVNVDEEMANILIYQKAYDAAARIVSEIDQMLDRLINGTGRVGL